MESPLFKDIIILFVLSVLIIFVFHRLKIPAIVGFLFTGLIVGPHSLGIVHSVKEVESLAELGVVLLLFIVGIEFSLKKLIRVKKTVLLGGSIQVLITIFIIYTICYLLNIPYKKAILISFIISLSSTAIVLKILRDKNEMDSPHGKTILGILIFQDIIFVPMMLIIPLFSGGDPNLIQSILLLLAKVTGIIIFIFLSIKWIFPYILYQIIKTRSNELFLISVFVICFTMALLTHAIGMSFALGGFLAGLMISETDYDLHIIDKVLPFQDILTSFFFISVGMLLDIRILVNYPIIVLACVIGVLAIKSVIAIISSIILGFSMRINVLVGLAISQIGEFSFVLIETGIQNKIIHHKENIYHYILSATILTMTLTPLLMKIAPYLANLINKIRFFRNLNSGNESSNTKENNHSIKDHLIIIGYGVNGRHLARASKLANIPYIILDMNPETVRNESQQGENIYFGDASQESILKFLECDRAKMLVVAISDPEATKRIIKAVRHLNEEIYIIARSRFLEEMVPLLQLGADDVIPQEYETSIEIFTRVMVNFLIPKHQIENLIEEIRSEEYPMNRYLSKESTNIYNLKHHLPDQEINAIQLHHSSTYLNKSISEVKLRSELGITILAIKRDKNILSNPPGDTVLQDEDILVVLGRHEDITQFTKQIE